MKTLKDRDLDFAFNQVAGDYIRKQRERIGMTLEQLAIRVRTTKQNIYKYETNKSRLKVDMFISICYAIGLNPAEAYREIVELVKQRGL